jgi:hypothetical protein
VDFAFTNSSGEERDERENAGAIFDNIFSVHHVLSSLSSSSREAMQEREEIFSDAKTGQREKGMQRGANESAQRDDKAVKNPSKAFNLLLSREESNSPSSLHSRTTAKKNLMHTEIHHHFYEKQLQNSLIDADSLSRVDGKNLAIFEVAQNTFSLIIFHAWRTANV